MKVGIGSYAFMWSIGFPGAAPEHPMTAIGLLEKAIELGTFTDDTTSALQVNGPARLDGGCITTDGDGDFSAKTLTVGNSNSDSSNITSDGNGSLTTVNVVLSGTSTPSLPTPGQIYFDGTHFQGWNGTVWKQLEIIKQEGNS